MVIDDGRDGSQYAESCRHVEVEVTGLIEPGGELHSVSKYCSTITLVTD